MQKACSRHLTIPPLACRTGFSLLEVILALAIIGGAVAVLGEAARLALRNAAYARDMARAQLLCESKLSEIVGGVTPAEPVSRAVIARSTDSGEPAWLYSIETTTLAEEGLLSVRVSVTRDLPAEQANNLERVLLNVADSLERRTWRRLDLAVRLIEPILLLLLAIVVLILVIALLLPVLKMSSTLS